MKKTSYDALLVVNQNTEWASVIKQIEKRSYSQLYILSSHHLLEQEQLKISKSLPAGTKLVISNFSDHLTDEEMLQCDAKAASRYQEEGYHPMYYKKHSIKFILVSYSHFRL